MSYLISTLADLEALYGDVNPTSLRKELPHLTPEYRRMIEASPFCAVATSGPGGLDCSPRGDPTGFVRVIDANTVAFADRRGNNRLDTLRNLMADPRIALLFLVPGVNETLRINGRATVTREPALMGSFAMEGKLPTCVVTVVIDAVYFQCGRAVIRSMLWDASRQVKRDTLPTAGQMTRAADATFDAETTFDAEAYDAALPARQAATLY
jgi:uncharacterized protein